MTDQQWDIQRSLAELLSKCKISAPKTDVCPICEQHKDDIQSAMTEIDKLAAIDKYSAHLFEVKAERQALYKMRNTRI